MNMSRVEKTVFLSYRHTNQPWALLISQNLTHHGFDVFLDYKGIASGDFERVILENIRARAHFLVLLTPAALDRCDESGDWLRREIEEAQETRCNVVPLMLEGFDFKAPAVASKLTGKLAMLKQYHGLPVPAEYFEEAMTKLRDRYLNVALKGVTHPASEFAQQAAKIQQAAAAAEPLVQPREVTTAQEWFERGLHEGERSRSKDPRPRYQPSQILLKSLVTVLIGTVLWFGGGGDWIESRLFDAVRIERASLYAKILFFRDKRLAEPHMVMRTLYPLGGILNNQPNSLNDVELYDEALYLKTYHLRKYHPDKLTFRSLSSGITDVIGISPGGVDLSGDQIDEYGRTHFKTLIYTTTVRDSNDIQIAHKYYNGFQYNQVREKYESDGSLNLEYAAREVVVTFDFSSIGAFKQGNSFRLKGQPKLNLIIGNIETPIEGHFTNGIFTSDTIKDVPQGARITCDWEWETEEQIAMVH
ncbi:MAG: toll/interleukin-1 receptor domain-containing protein [Nitrospira sp.]|nr:toll/interleukin-1 receptor domain-containing protein [Nitrospira sp.]MDH4354820.1 toll/interleukin-1 receptor domain-containing protein [Nitrospira sp.]MDH5317106.1 toll/interleukin-1 receptor domain-containing protein [Nitrospira sp.]